MSLPHMDKKDINLALLKATRQDLEDEIRSLKKDLGATWSKGVYMGDLQNGLRELRIRATDLCILRAWVRGRWHLKDQTLCLEAVRHVAPEFLLKDQTRPAA